jgi:hypothetical protein
MMVSFSFVPFTVVACVVVYIINNIDCMWSFMDVERVPVVIHKNCRPISYPSTQISMPS